MNQMNFEQARHNMIEQQIRPWEVLDQRVLEVLAQVHREDFVPPQFRNLAFSDLSVPLGRGEVMMAPKVEARMLQALEVRADDTVLEVGTGSGYVTALLATLGRHVYSVEIAPEFKMDAARRLAAHGLDNVTLEVGDGATGWDRHGPYDVIAITGSLPTLPRNFEESLSIGGRLFAILGDSPVMSATLVTRVGEDEWAHETLFETDLPPLLNAPRVQRFTL